jgi:DNA helicase HerA-like ATPase
LYLIVVTQRPRKVDSNILSECDNLFLMRVTNSLLKNYLKRAFVFKNIVDC